VGPLDRLLPVALGDLQSCPQYPLGLTAVQGQDLVRADPLNRHGEVVVGLEDSLGVLSPRVLPGGQHAPTGGLLAQGPTDPGILGDPLGHDVPSPRQGLLHTRHLGGQEALGLHVRGRTARPLDQDALGQGLETLFPGHLGTGPTSGTVGKVQVLQGGQRRRRTKTGLQLWGQAPLPADLLQDGGSPLLQGPQ